MRTEKIQFTGSQTTKAWEKSESQLHENMSGYTYQPLEVKLICCNRT